MEEENNKIIDLLYINSRNRFSGSLNNFNYRLKTPLENVKYILVNNVNIYHTEPSITSKNNNLYFQHTDGTYYQTVITEGFYTINELITELTIKMNESIGLTLIYTNNEIDESKCFYIWEQSVRNKQLKVKFGGVGAGTFSIEMKIGETFGGFTTSSTIFRIVGFQYSLFSSVTEIEGFQVPHLSTRYYEIRSDICQNKIHDHKGSRNVLCKVSQVANDGGLILEKPCIPIKLEPVSSTIHQINIQVYNDKNQWAEINDDFTIDLLVVRKK